MKMIFRLKTSRKVLGSVIFVCIGFYVMGILGNAYSRHILLEQMLGSLDAQAAYMQSRMEQFRGNELYVCVKSVFKRL